LQRNIRWEDRIYSAPLRLGDHPDWHLAWRRGALFERLTEEKLALTEGLSEAARKARSDFGLTANKELTDTLDVVKTAADELGVPTAGAVNALLDANSVKFGTGAISLHDANNIPLSSLGTGSKRLLVAGLARKVTKSANISLVDEIETGLEPHRIRSLLNALGAKEKAVNQQVFATTHSPVVLRELNHKQLTLLRLDQASGNHMPFTPDEASQGVLRGQSEAFLAKRIIICEGKSEVGFLRGFDQHSADLGGQSMEAMGTVLIDAGGASKVLKPALEFLRIGFDVSIFMDSDKPLLDDDEAGFIEKGGSMFKWPNGWALEDAVFQCVPCPIIGKLLDFAATFPNENKMNDQIQSASSNQLNLLSARGMIMAGAISEDACAQLGKAARSGDGWFKQIAPYEHISRSILAPNWASLHQNLTKTTTDVLNWAWHKDV
jgi:putative ATP-dependent endonuclease of OLD family